MRQIYSITKEDFIWSELTDFLVENGDIKDTRSIPGKGFAEEVNRRIMTGFSDWKLSSAEGANLYIFKGRNNNPNLWREISDSISFSLTKDSFMSSSDFKVTIAPSSESEVIGRIDFSNRVRSFLSPELSSIKLFFNLDGQGPFIMRS